MNCLFGVVAEGVTTVQLSPGEGFTAPIDCANIALCILGGETMPAEYPVLSCRPPISPKIGTDGDGE